MILAIIQARMESTRLPGKVLKPLNGDTVLGLLIKRVKMSKRIERIVVATTRRQEDLAIEQFADNMEVDVFRGSEEDVLDRFYRAAKEFNANIIVRLTSDCPFIDPEICDQVIGHYLSNREKYDYVSNTIKLSYPDGLGVEVFSFRSLEYCWREARHKFEREHVTQYIRRNSNKFNVGNVSCPCNYSMHRWTVDNHEDILFIREIYKRLFPLKGHAFLMEDILELVAEYPELSEINAHFQRDEGLSKSLKEHFENIKDVDEDGMGKRRNTV